MPPSSPSFGTRADTVSGPGFSTGFDTEPGPAPASRPWRCATLYARAGLDSLGMIAAYVRSACRRGGVGEGAALRLRIAVEELAVNAIVHGYGDCGHGRLILTGGGDGRGGVSVQLFDSAAPFDPSAAPGKPRLDLPVRDRPVGGLGLHLALTSADEYRYEYADGQNRSTLTVRRRADEN